MFDAELAAAALVAVVVVEDAGAPYWARAPDIIEVKRSRENDSGDMVDFGCASWVREG